MTTLGVLNGTYLNTEKSIEIDIEALAAAIVAKLPTTSLTVDDVTTACKAALNSTSLHAE